MELFFAKLSVFMLLLFVSFSIGRLVKSAMADDTNIPEIVDGIASWIVFAAFGYLFFWLIFLSGWIQETIFH